MVPGRRGVFVQKRCNCRSPTRSQRTGPEKSGEGTSSIAKKAS